MHAAVASPDGFATKADPVRPVGVRSYALLQGAFLLIIFFKLYFDQFIGVLCLIWLLATVLRVSSCLHEGFRRREVSDKSWRSFIASLFSVAFVACTLYVFRHDEMFKIFLLIPPSQPSTSWITVIWKAAVVDCSVKLLGAFLKNIFLLIPQDLLNSYQMGSAMIGIEWFSVVLRNFYVGALWILYFAEINWQTRSPLFQRIFFTALYTLFKIVSLVFLYRSWRSSIRSVFQNKPYTIQTVSDMDNSCVLCFQSYTRAGVLPCAHQICEKCVSAWCNRHPFCPSCNEHICVDTSWRDGSLDMWPQLF